MSKSKIDASITTDELKEWYTASDAAKVLSANSGRIVEPDYLFKLGKLGKIQTRKLGPRATLYAKGEVDQYKVEPRGKKSGAAKRQGKTGPTVRELRQAKLSATSNE